MFQPLSADLFDREIAVFNVGHFRRIIPEIELRQIAVQIAFADAAIDALEPAFRSCKISSTGLIEIHTPFS